MTRNEFIKKCLTAGIGIPFLSMFLESCDKDEVATPQFEINFDGKIIIIGAGVAGLTAAYLLHRNNIDFEIIEASSIYGGRIKRTDQLADFPIDLGAEWIHGEPTILSDITADPTLNATVDLVTYSPETIYNWKNGKLRKQNWAHNFYSEYKFKSTTWYGFFERFIVPDFESKIIFNEPVNTIDYNQDKVEVTTANNTYQADKVLITTSVKVLQNTLISFSPQLPVKKVNAINSIEMGDGLKVFIEFRKKFYPDILLFGGVISALTSESKIFYDAAFRKGSNKHVLGLFTINEKAAEYVALGSEQNIINEIMRELDEIFDGEATKHYVKHVIQNWSAETYIGGSYSYNFTNNQQDTVNAITEPLNNKVYFAGEALSVDYQATVHGANESAFKTIERMLKN